MKMQRNQTNCSDDEYDEYTYLYDLIEVEKRNPNLKGHHPMEESYWLLKKIAESGIKCKTMRSQLVSLLEENINND